MFRTLFDERFLPATLCAIGLLCAGWLLRLARRRPADFPALDRLLSERAFSSKQVASVFALLLTLYVLAAGIGLFFYEEQIAAVRLATGLFVYALVLAFVARVLRTRDTSWREAFGLDRQRFASLLLAPVCYLALFPFVLVVALATRALIEWTTGGAPVPQEVVRTVAGGGIVGHLYVAVALLIAPFFEEVLFRGILFPALARALGIPLATLATSLAFAGIHVHAPSFLPLFLLSLLLCFAYRRTAGLWLPIGIHFFFNLAGVLFVASG